MFDLDMQKILARADELQRLPPHEILPRYVQAMRDCADAFAAVLALGKRRHDGVLPAKLKAKLDARGERLQAAVIEFEAMRACVWLLPKKTGLTAQEKN